LHSRVDLNVLKWSTDSCSPRYQVRFSVYGSNTVSPYNHAAHNYTMSEPSWRTVIPSSDDSSIPYRNRSDVSSQTRRALGIEISYPHEQVFPTDPKRHLPRLWRRCVASR
jgi:hypothetical protein